MANTQKSNIDAIIEEINECTTAGNLDRIVLQFENTNPPKEDMERCLTAHANAKRFIDIKTIIVDAETNDRPKAKDLELYLHNITLEKASQKQKEIVAAAIKRLLDNKEKATSFVKIYNALGKTQVRNIPGLSSALQVDFPEIYQSGSTQQTTTAPDVTSSTTAAPDPQTTTAAPDPQTTTAAPDPQTTTAAPDPQTTTAAPDPQTTTASPDLQNTTTVQTEPHYTFTDTDFKIAWHANSSLDFFKEAVLSSHEINEQIEQRVPDPAKRKKEIDWLADFIEKISKDADINKTYTISELLEARLEEIQKNYKITLPYEYALKAIAQRADEIDIAAERKTSRWAEIKDSATALHNIALSGMKFQDISSFSAHGYIEDNIINNAIFVTFVPYEQRQELLKINNELARKRNAGLSKDDLLNQFLSEMENSKSPVPFSEATKEAVSDFIRRAEKLDKHITNMENKRKEQELQNKIDKIVNNAQSASSTKECLETIVKDTEFISLLNLSDAQQEGILAVLNKVATEREKTSATEPFAKDFITKLQAEKIVDDKQLERLEKIAQTVDKRIAEEQLQDEAQKQKKQKDEYKALRDELMSSTDFKDYLASISPLLDAESLKNSLALKKLTGDKAPYEACAIALANPDWLIALEETYKNDWKSLSNKVPSAWEKITNKAPEEFKQNSQEYLKEEKDAIKSDIDGIILARLNMLQPGDITPENAYAWLHLASGISDSGLQEKINNMVSEALYKYDQEHFCEKYNDTFKNYEQATRDLQNFIGDKKNFETIMDGRYTFVADYDEKNKKETPLSWWRDCVTTEEGGPINSINAQQKLKKDVLSLAAELVAQDYAKQPPVDKTGKPLSGKEKNDKMREDLEAKVAQILGDIDYLDKDGKRKTDKFTVTKDTVIAGLAANMSEAETFKDRIKTKFKQGALGQNISNSWKKLDSHLTNRYGQKYIIARKICKNAAKTGYSAGKFLGRVGIGIGQFAVANAVAPGVGPAALIAYNTVKQWKSVHKQLNDASLTNAQKKALIIGTGLTTLLSATAALTAISPVLDACGINTPEAIQHMSNTMASYGVRLGRVAAITLGNTAPNLVKMWALRRQSQKINKEISETIEGKTEEAKKLSLEEKEAKVKELLKKQQEIQTQKAQNNHDTIKKAASAALGSFIGMAFGGNITNMINEGFHAGVAHVTEPNASTNDAPQSQPAPDTSIADKPGTENESDNNFSFRNLFSSCSSWFTETYNGMFSSSEPSPQVEEQGAPAGSDKPAEQGAPAGSDKPAEQDAPAGSDKPAEQGAPAGSDKPAEQSTSEKPDTSNDNTTDNKTENNNNSSEDANSTDSHAKNLEDAKVEGTSGHGNMSTYDDTVRHLTNLGDSRFEDINATAKQLCEHLGDKANMALIACRMDPTDVYNALGLSGSNTPVTSYATIDHLANHDLTPEQQTNLNNLLQEKFGNWYSNADTHSAAPDSHATDTSTQQNNSDAKPADAPQADAAEGKNNTAAKAEAVAQATATAAVAAATDQAAAKTTVDTASAEFHKMNVPQTGDKTVDTLNAKYAVTNDLEGDAKSSIQFNKISAEEAVRLDLAHEQSTPGSQQPAQQQPAQQQQQPAQQQQQPAQQQQQPEQQPAQQQPKGHATVEHRQPTSHQADQHSSSRNSELPADAAVPIIYGSTEWAVQQGYRYNPLLSMGLNHGGIINSDGTIYNQGYASVYTNPLNGRAVLIPNNPVEDRDLVKFSSIKDLKDDQHYERGPYAPTNSRLGALNSVLYGSGHIKDATSFQGKVMAAISTGFAFIDGMRAFGHHKG